MSSSLDEACKSVIEYNRCVADQLQSICDPIFKHNVTSFAYLRLFQNGKYLYLCNDLDWVKRHISISNVPQNNTELGKQIHFSNNDGYGFFLWPSTPKDSVLQELYDNNVWNGFSIFKKLPDSVEVWGLASTREQVLIQDFYLKHTEELKDFTKFFNEKAKHLISPEDPRKLAIRRNDLVKNPTLDHQDFKEIQHFIQITNPSRYPIIVNGREILLSQRESQCLSLIALGMTIKEIALSLCISPRSVELYVKNTRMKLNCSSKDEMIAMFKKSVMEWA